ncbi:MAG: bifunctional [glutamate--ammonia ligase]-adenylyl-L-tyrosine phosphorylase/[glutamate--ammonia-ligase] adenylyltransferase [Gemmataceae bacterium]
MDADSLLSRLHDPDRGRRIISTIGAQKMSALLGPLTSLLARGPDPDMALNNLERYLAAAPDSLAGLLADDARGLEVLLQLLGTSQFFADTLVANPDFLDMLRVPLRQSPSFDELREQLRSDVDAAREDSGVLRAIRRFRQRQALRIGTNDIIHDRPLEEVTRDLSNVADASLEVAFAVALQTASQRLGQPHSAAGDPSRCVVLAFGKLGGRELNYSSDIDLMFVYDEDGGTRGKRGSVGNDEFYARVVGEVVRLVSAFTDRGQAYRIDLRLRPEGQRGPLARSAASTLSYYDTLGRTWERQALIKLRPVAGDLALGDEFLRNVESFVYGKYLSFAEINEIKAMKRRIEQKAHEAGRSRSEVKTGRGGIRDIEFTIQFLQLLNGGDLPALRERNTLLAMLALETAGCLTPTEFQILGDAYRFLRRTEHRLQLLFDLQTHRLPDSPGELRKLALRMGYVEREAGSGKREVGKTSNFPRSPLSDAPPEVIDTRDLLVDPLDSFLHDYYEKARLDRQILDHLLHSAFADSAGQAEPETDLILDSEPDESDVRAVLGRYRFHDIGAAYRNLTQLAQESVPFLSTRRCRHFLASIAPALLRELAEAPDPDLALLNLEKVTASLGAKAVLWELFSFSPPSLKLTVELCAGSQFLTEILIHNPGMIDDLLDSLVLNQPRTIDELRLELVELCRGAADLEPILHSFQDKELLRIGVRDLLGKSPIRETTAALTDVAETILGQVAALESAALAKRFGTPALEAGGPARFVVLGLGKLGGREMSYHSDLDLILIYEDDGQTVSPLGRFGESTDNSYYFTELAQRIIRSLSHAGPTGRLYKVDMRLRPAGRSGSLVTPLAEFRRYFAQGAALWERQALTRARPVFGDSKFGAEVMTEVFRCAFHPPWRPEHADEIAAMRERLEASRSRRDVKRGPGGQVDIEFLVQLFQLKYGGARPELRVPNTWLALDALWSAGLLDAVDHVGLRGGYDFLRQVESRLRIMTNRALDEVPESDDELAKLARRLDFDTADGFRVELERVTTETRGRFRRLLERERQV